MVRKERTLSMREPLTRERVILAAIALADADGLDPLSMRKLAQTLNVEAMSLYNHVANKDDVLDGMVDQVISEIELPQINDDWQSAMRSRSISCHKVLIRHPWAPLLIVGRVNIGPSMLNYINATLGCLVEAGFSYEMADRAWNTIDSHVYGFTLQQLNFPLEPNMYSTAARGFLPMLPADSHPYMRELTLMVAEGQHDGLHDFTFGLNLILDGLERYRTV